MASIKFYLTRPNAKVETAIFFHLNYGAYEIVSGKKKYLPLKYYTNESILPEFWDTKSGHVKETRKFPQYPEFNARLKKIENNALDILRRLQNDGIEPTNDVLKKKFDKIWKAGRNQTEESTTGMELMQYIEHFIKTSNVKESTKKSYRVVEKNLKEYQLQENVKLKFASIDIDFYNAYVKYMKLKKNYAPNTIGTHIKNLITFLSSAKERGLPVNEDFKKKAFAKPKEETEAIYLTETELDDIYKLDLDKISKLDRVRDLFLIGAHTGLRFSDLSQLNKDNIKGNTIVVKTIKTGVYVVIPMKSSVRSILAKHGGNLPRIPSNQKFNDYIKEITKLAGIVEPVKVEQTKGDLSIKISVPKYELTTSHTARRSFATNAFLAGIPVISIMKITGHKTESAFMKYIKISQEDNAQKLMQYDFFTKLVVNE